jgi:nicotinamidase-related amidase
VPKLKERITALGSSATTLEKLEFDATKNPAILAHLETLRSAGKTHVVLTGMEAHICVYQTARGLVSRGFHVQVAGDATASRTKSNATLARKLWSASGATISGTETVLFDLLGKAGGDAFKAISKRLR